MKTCAVEYACGPAAAATSHTTSATAYRLKTMPLILFAIDKTDVSWGR
jgi:hypothetical protein